MASVVFSLALAALHVTGSLYPAGLLWGIHFFAFLPTPFLIVYIVLLLASVLYAARGNVEKRLNRIVRFLEEKTGYFLSLSCLVFAAVAVVFRIQVPLLGDAYTLTNNIENTINGEHPLSLGNEPLSIFFLYGVAKVLVARSFPEIMNAIFVAEILLLCGFVVVVFYSVKLLFPERGDIRTILAMLFLLALPYMQLFWGYAESYTVVLFMVSVTILVALLHQRGKLPFWIALPVFIVQFCVHYLGAILIPLLGYLAYHEYRKNGRGAILRALLAGAPIVVAMLALVGFNIGRLLPEQTHSHVLPLAGVTDQFAAYTLFSGYHAIDLLNLFLFMTPGITLLFFLSRSRLSMIRSSPTSIILLIVAVPFLLFVLTARFDLGMAKDWDVPASYFYVLALLAVLIFLQDGSSVRVRSMCVIIVVTILSSFAFFQVNAIEDAGVRRVQSLMDHRIMPQSGYFQTSFHLSMYYVQRHDIDSLIETWIRYTHEYPDDPRGYAKLVKSYWEYGERSYGAIMETYGKWRQVAPADTAMRNVYANLCLVAGDASAKAGRTEEASARYRKAIELRPSFAASYNNLGILYHTRGAYDQAAAQYRKAIGVDSSYARGYRNLASEYVWQGHPDSALFFFRRAIALDPGYMATYEQMAQAYETLGKPNEALPLFQQAARLGSPSAKQLLTQRGYSW